MGALLVVLIAAAPAAVQLNTDGFRLYLKGELEPALQKFQLAVAADETYALAHYNAAATMARLRAARDLCGGGPEYDVLGELTRAIELDPGRRKRALADADFKPLMGTLAYRRLLLGVTEKTHLRLLLEGTSFSSFASWGSFGNLVNLRFLPNGQLQLGIREVSDVEPFSNGFVDHPGTWRVEGTTLHIRMKRAADKKYEGKAAFLNDELEFPSLGKLVNYVSGACDA